MLLKTARPDSALSEFTAALTRYPSSATLHYLSGLALEASGRHPDALKAYLHARSLDPGFAEVQYLTAALARRQRRPALADSALQDYRRLQDIGRQDPILRKKLKGLRASVLDSPEDPLHHFQLARFFARQGFDREALNGFARVLELNPEDLRSHNHVGSILLKNKQPSAALNHFERALRLGPTFVPALVNAGNTCMLLKRHRQATTHYARAVELAPASTLIWHYLARAHLDLNQRGPAAQALRRGLATPGAEGKLRLAMEELLGQVE